MVKTTASSGSEQFRRNSSKDQLERKNRLSTRHIGLIGEAIAHRYLVDRGYKILARNWRTSSNGMRGELDLISSKDGALCAIEVKTRTNLHCGSPFDAVNSKKQHALRNLTALYLVENPAGFQSVQIDVIAINLELSQNREALTTARVEMMAAVC